MTTDQERALLPCPFCGGEASMRHWTDEDDCRWAHIVCSSCAVATRGKWHTRGSDCPQYYAEIRDEWNRRAALASAPPASAEPVRGYVALGTGQYVINHSRAGEPAELCITLATDEDKSGNRQVGESRDNPPDAPPIEAKDMLIRIAFTSERGLFALEDQLAMVRKVHFTDYAAPPAQAAATPSVCSCETCLKKLGCDYPACRSDHPCYGARAQIKRIPPGWHALIRAAYRAGRATVAEDSERYRWLRSVDSYGEWTRLGHYAADALDAAIDAARGKP